MVTTIFKFAIPPRRFEDRRSMRAKTGTMSNQSQNEEVLKEKR